MSDMSIFTLVILSNSPGEISSWVKPVCYGIQLDYPHVQVEVMLTPCQYASGRERDEVLLYPNVKSVLSPAETLNETKSFFRKTPKHGALLMLGGDPMYARLLSKKYQIPAFAYTEHRRSPGRFFKHVFTKHLDGDLMAASVNLDSEPVQRDPNLILFLMGSRPGHFKALVPFFNDVAKQLKQRHPKLDCVLSPSPFVSPALIASVPKDGFQLANEPAVSIMPKASLIITIPGTNTAQAMYMHTPMIVFIPLNRPDLIVFDGLPGLIGSLPFIGTAFKRFVIWIVKRLKQVYALPNIMAGRSIVPEIAQHLTIEETVETIDTLFSNADALAKQREDLANYSPNTDVLTKILSTILSH